MTQAKVGDTVKVHYTGKLNTGVIFESSRGSEPLRLEIGKRCFIQGFEEAIVGMSPGENKIVVISPEKGYGRYNEEKVIKLDKKDFPKDIIPVEGMALEIPAKNGVMVPAEITEISDTTITLDANHPLAEQTLTFEIELIEIVNGNQKGA